jgi:hypothetical protein
MKSIALTTFAAVTLSASAAAAAPLYPAGGETPQVSNVDQVRLVCNEYGRCYHSRGQRIVVQRDYDDDDAYVVRRSYNYHGGPDYYERRTYGYGGPSIGFSFGSRGW